MQLATPRQKKKPLVVTAPTRNWRFSGYLKLCASYQVQRWQAVFVSDIAKLL